MRTLLLTFFILYLGSATLAQSDTTCINAALNYDNSENIELLKFDLKHIQNYKKDKDFIYEYDQIDKKPGFIAKILKWIYLKLLKFFIWLFGHNVGSVYLSNFIKYIPYITLVAVLLIIIKLFMNVYTKELLKGQNNTNVVSLTEEEELLQNSNLHDLISQAVANGNYRLAVRYYYILMLQKLNEKEFIDWEQQKTNDDYLREIKSEKIAGQFENLTYLYDFIWYGNFDINQVEFKKVELNFNNLNRQLDTK